LKGEGVLSRQERPESQRASFPLSPHSCRVTFTEQSACNASSRMSKKKYLFYFIFYSCISFNVSKIYNDLVKNASLLLRSIFEARGVGGSVGSAPAPACSDYRHPSTSMDGRHKQRLANTILPAKKIFGANNNKPFTKGSEIRFAPQRIKL
jgi:hypothetical protein